MKLLKSKRNVIVLMAIILIASAVGGTYAWFSASSKSVEATIDLGNIKIEADFTDGNEGYMEPGASVPKTGSVENTGTLTLAAKLDMGMGITVFRDEDGIPLTNAPDGQPAPDGDDYVDIIFDIMNMVAEDVIEIDGEYYFYAWMYDKNNPDDLYLYADPKTGEIDLDFTVYFSEDMGNQYMDAKVNFDQVFKATQMNPKAILAELNIDQTDLGYVSELQINGNSLGRSASASASNAKHEMIKAWVEEVMSR